MTMPLLRLCGVTRRYGSRAAIEDVSLDVASGENVAVLGASGSGKTTILRLIAGLDRPDVGEVWIDGVLVANNRRLMVPACARRVGLVFQDLALWPHLTARENVAFVAESGAKGTTERAARVDDALQICRVDASLSGRYPHELSGGEQQRVALARALVGRPRILLLDEPFSSLDTNLRAILRREFSDLQRQLSLTTIYVTHDQADVAAVASRAIVMRDGRVEGIRSTAEPV
jgi:ABC-type Fe3+/spermidine/putrescine transport system ATPase subunit